MHDNEEYLVPDELQKALIIAGMREIERHGLADFSLRRVAADCSVSCAAPYRHFKNKSELILAIIFYVNQRRELLENQIIECFEGDIRRTVTELCVANVRFFAANPNFRHIMLLDAASLDEDQRAAQSRMFSKLSELILSQTDDKDEGERRAVAARAMILGFTHMLGSGELENNDKIFDDIRRSFEKIFE